MKHGLIMAQWFFNGFLGSAMFMDKPEVLLVKAKIYFVATVIISIIGLVNYIRNER